MPKSSTQATSNPRMAAIHTFGHPNAATPRTGWSDHDKAFISSPGLSRYPTLPLPGAPVGLALTQGAAGVLIATWSAPASSATQGIATSYNLAFRPAGSGTWTTVSNATSPFNITGLNPGSAYDVQVESVNTTGSGPWSAIANLATAIPGPFAPNVPTIVSVVPVADGTVSKLAVAWNAPTTDSTHGAASGYNLRYSPSGTGTWTTVTGASSPATIASLNGATAYDVQVQAINAAASPSAWSGSTTASTWGATVAPGGWVPANSQTHGAAVAPNGGANLIAVAAPTAVTGGAFAWSPGNTAVPTSGLIAGGADGVTNGWGQWFNAPTTAGTYYLWLLAQATGGVTSGALVTGPIVVS
jgi:hypothetical protein